MIVIRFLIRLLVFGNFYIAIGAALITAETFILLNTTPDKELILLVFLVSFVLYNIQRLVLVKDPDTAGEREVFIIENRNLLWGLTICAFIPGTYLFFSVLQLHQQLIFMAASVLAVGYFFPGVSLRKLPGLKAILIGACWSLITTGLCWKDPSTPFPVLFSIGKFSFIAALGILFDIRDISRDQLSRTYSFPVLMGIRATKIIAAILLLLSAAILIYSEVEVWPVIIVYLGAMVCVILSEEKRQEYFYSLGIDGIIILRALMIIFFSQNSIL